VLKKHWPDVPNLGDITKVDWSEVERPDVICGGYPCQPFSTAGKRGGANDPRHLWPAMHNAIRVLRPRYALMENVRGHLSLGFGRVLGDLAEIGYDAEWQVIPAAAVGAPHKRDRVFIVAYPNDTGNRTPERRIDYDGATQIKKRQIFSQFEFGRHSTNVANAESKQSNGRQSASDTKQPKQKRLQKQVRTSGADVVDTDSEFVGQYGSSSDVANQGRQRHDQRERQKTNDFGQWWEVEPNVGRVANGVSDRVDRLKGLGNAIVPQVAEFVGALVVEHSQN
jgi:DNA-cytosine methyltransferase